MSEKVLVTGGGGFLGEVLCRQLMEKGLQVVSTQRGHSEVLEGMGVVQVLGDIRKEADLERAFREAGPFSACFHVAAKAGFWGDPKDFESINIQGTANLLALLKKYEVINLIYTSSPSVIFDAAEVKGEDETLPYPSRHYSDYSRTKEVAEKMVFKASGSWKRKTDGASFQAVALRPHLIWGPKDNHILPTMMRKAKAGLLKQVGDGTNKVDVTYVDNAAWAHVLAFEKLAKGKGESERQKVGGEAFFIGPEEPVNLWDFINRLLKLHRMDPIKKRVPAWLARSLGRGIESFYRSMGKYSGTPPAMTPFLAMQLSQNHYYSHEKAKRLLGYHPIVTLEEGIKLLGDSLWGGELERQVRPSA